MLNKNGYLHMILGPMFSGKTSKLIDYIRRHKILNQNILVIKPEIDKRYNEYTICSHNKETEKCILGDIENLKKILNDDSYNNCDVIFIEEAQFFKDLYITVLKMLEDKKNVYVAGLNGDCFKNHFGEIHRLIPHVDKIETMTGLCRQCNNGTVGIFTKRKIKNNDTILVGGADLYEVVCRYHSIN